MFHQTVVKILAIDSRKLHPQFIMLLRLPRINFRPRCRIREITSRGARQVFAVINHPLPFCQICLRWWLISDVVKPSMPAADEKQTDVKHFVILFLITVTLYFDRTRSTPVHKLVSNCTQYHNSRGC